MSLREAAREWWRQGFNVVALYFEPDPESGKVVKRPFAQWSEWQSRRQTEEEFEAQPWDKADGFGIVTNYPSNEGLYLAAVDLDVVRVSEEAKARGERLFELFPITRIERSISGGMHKVYLSRVKPRNISKYHDTHALELVAAPKLCVMAPSKGYRALNDNPPRVVEDAEALFYQVLGVEDERANNINKGYNAGLLESWLEHIKPFLRIKGEGPNYLYCHCPFHPPDNHPSFAIHKTKFYGIDYHDGRVYSLKELAEALGVELPGVSPEVMGEEEAKINLFNLAKEIVAGCPIVTDIRTYLMYRWNGKFWVDDAEGFIHKRLLEVEGERYRPYHLTTLIQMVQGLTFVNGLHEPPPSLICFENGVLDIETGEFQPHNPKFFFRNIIHAEYNPNAPPPKEFLTWLNEIMPDEEARKCIQELFGYCLYRDYCLHHVFMLVGSGRNGKGTLMRTLISLLGVESCANIPLERLGERFQATNLLGKLINVVAEPNLRKVSTEVIKALTGQDLISGEIKGKQKLIQFINYAKIVIMANRLPPIRDTTPAWSERLIIIEFPVTIPPEKMIPNIEERWLKNPEERSGIINWALEGLRRLLQNKRFTKSETMRNALEQYKKWSNSIEYFLDKCCEFGPNLWVAKRELYNAYKEFCEEEGLLIEDEATFSKEVRRRPNVDIAQKRIAGKVERVWVGISLKRASFEAGEAGFTYTGKAEGMSDKKDENFIQYIKAASVASPASPGGSLWVCGDCAKESGRFIVLERFGRCELCGREAELGRLPAEPKDEGANEKEGGQPNRPFTVLERVTPIRWLPCPFCGGTGLEYYVKFVDGSEASICAGCAMKLKEKWGGG